MAQVNVLVHQFTQTQAEGQAGRQQQPGVGHQAVIVEGDVDAVGVQVVASVGCSLFLAGLLSHKPLSQIQRSTFSRPQHTFHPHSFGGFRLSPDPPKR